MFQGYFIKYNPKEPMEDCGYIAVFWRRGKNQQMVQTENGCHEDVFLSGTTFYVNGDFFI
jgi:hypothetical protein